MSRLIGREYTENLKLSQLKLLLLLIYIKKQHAQREGKVRGELRCCRRLHNKQICVPQNAYFFKKVLKAAELIFAGAVDS